MASDAELMMALFQGSDMTFGRTDPTNEISNKGKRESRSWLEKRAITVKDWEAHLAGSAGVGIPPLRGDGKVRWGAIDVDLYEGNTIESVHRKIEEFRLPLVVLRSKSGGPHIFMFCSDWVPAKLMLEKLDAMAGFLGFGTSEVFPKQTTIVTDGPVPDYGSWINMPYFGGTKFLRYGLAADGSALADIPAFIAFANSRTLPPDDLRALVLPQVTEELFPNGPPCLNSIMAQRPSDLRNIILSNAAVYCRKAYGENWKPKLDEVNARFSTPLGSSEVESIKKSYGKKDYRYQCSNQPLCNFCVSSECKKRQFGIGTSDFLPATRSLSMVDTDPPIWYLDITMPDGKDIRMSLTTEQLQNPRLFQRRAMETTRQMPPSVKIEAWEPIVQGMMAHCRYIPVPKEATPVGQFLEHVQEFFANRPSQNSIEDVMRGLVFRDTRNYYFRLKDLWTYLASKKFVGLKQNEMLNAIRENMSADKAFKTIKGSGVNIMVVPRGIEVIEAPTVELAVQPIPKPF